MSARAFADHAAALADVDAIRDRVANGTFEVEHVPNGLWWWRMSVGNDTVACSAHGFARRVDATLAGGRFRQRAPSADADLNLAVFQPGRRGREVPLDTMGDTVNGTVGDTESPAAMRPQRSVG